MSFDDVARRMKRRHAENGIVALDDEIQLPAPGTVDPVAMNELRRQRRAQAVRQIILGALLLGGGAIMFLLTRDPALQGNELRFFTYAPLGLGIVALIRGLATLGS